MRRPPLRPKRASLMALGAFGVVVGVIWMGQGFGYFPYPHQSFMIDQTIWGWRGGVLVGIGIVCFHFARRMRG